MFSWKSDLVPGFKIIREFASEYDGIVALDTYGKTLEQKISFTLIMIMIIDYFL